MVNYQLIRRDVHGKPPRAPVQIQTTYEVGLGTRYLRKYLADELGSLLAGELYDRNIMNISTPSIVVLKG